MGIDYYKDLCRWIIPEGQLASIVSLIMKSVFLTYLEILLTTPPVLSEGDICRRLREDISRLVDAFNKFRLYISEEEVKFAAKPVITVIDSLCVERSQLLKQHKMLFADFGSSSVKVLAVILVLREETKQFSDDLLADAQAQQAADIATAAAVSKRQPSSTQRSASYVSISHYQDKLAKASAVRSGKGGSRQKP